MGQVTSYAFDPLGRQTKVTDALGGETSYAYDLNGNLLSLTDPSQNTTSWEYDSLDRAIRETNGLGFSRLYGYDAVGNLTRKTDRLGRVTTYAYDVVGRNTAERWLDAAGNVQETTSYQYNAVGQVTSADNPAANYDYQYDKFGQLTTEDQVITGLAPRIHYGSEYNSSRERTDLQASFLTTGSTTKIDFHNRYAYDAAHRLMSVIGAFRNQALCWIHQLILFTSSATAGMGMRRFGIRCGAWSGACRG